MLLGGKPCSQATIGTSICEDHPRGTAHCCQHKAWTWGHLEDRAQACLNCSPTFYFESFKQKEKLKEFHKEHWYFNHPDSMRQNLLFASAHTHSPINPSIPPLTHLIFSLHFNKSGLLTQFYGLQHSPVSAEGTAPSLPLGPPCRPPHRHPLGCIKRHLSPRSLARWNHSVRFLGLLQHLRYPGLA